MQRIGVIGAGDHGLVVVDILLQGQSAGLPFLVVAIADERPVAGVKHLLGVPLVGDLDALARHDVDAVVVAVGDNRARRAVTESVRTRGWSLATVRHPSAIVARDVEIGEGVMLCAGCVVGPSARVLAGTILNTGCSIDHHNLVGPFAHIAPGAHLGGTVLVGEGAMVGIGATVLPGCRIGAWATVGGGATVVGDVAADTTVVGVPARPR